MAMNNSRVAMMGPFISSLQIVIVPMMSLGLQKDEDLEEAGVLLYSISTADIIPDFLLIPLREALFGEFDEDDDFIPGWYDSIGYDTMNFIVCTGSILIFFQS